MGEGVSEKWHFGSLGGSLCSTLGHFGATSGLLWGHLRMTSVHFGVTLVRLWVHEVYLGITLVQFQKIFIFPIDFNDFISSSGHFGIALGSFGVTLGSFGAHFGVIFGIWGDFGALSGPIRRRKA